MLKGRQVDLANGNRIAVYKERGGFLIKAERRAGWCKFIPTTLRLSTEAMEGLLLILVEFKEK